MTSTVDVQQDEKFIVGRALLLRGSNSRQAGPEPDTREQFIRTLTRGIAFPFVIYFTEKVEARIRTNKR